MSGDNSYVNNLSPPVGTSYDEQETINVFENKILSFWENPRGLWKTEQLTWNVDLYKYVTGAKPSDPNFRQNGGMIYIVMVHGGIANNQDNARLNQYGYRVTVPSTLNTVLHYPATGSGTPDGANWDYTISFKQNMPMFNNGGNSPFNFQAEYQRNFTRILVEQEGTVTPTGVEFSWEYHKTLGLGGSWPINGLTLFKTQDPTIFPVTMKFEAWVYERLGVRPGYERYVGNASTDVSVDFKFTA
ncbi:hypothetical protein CCMSSC00406_0006964 [Pleurotus cornucopiae]|uniref:Uncharacterized protein n=1 Tax=Pleurotus cornucopiae TaxID=5321 RepID=A0ACB7IZ17_PLECO|nr:hypothetical protein CCMSSC00406_0006964 [Pleurotus cornucopiae]